MIENMQIQIISGVLLTSIISGFLGMGGGMMLMVLYSMILPVKIAMILHGITQLSSNSFRAYLHKSHIKFKVLLPYFVGSILVFIIFRSFKFVPNLGVLYLMLGLFPFVSFIPKIAGFFSITKNNRPITCGLAVTAAQLLAGASGGILDIFFINSPLTRFQIIATKAFTQSLGHIVKLIYYLSLISLKDDIHILNLYMYLMVIITAMCGTYIGKKILNCLSENNFRTISKGIILSIATSLIYKGIAYYI